MQLRVALGISSHMALSLVHANPGGLAGRTSDRRSAAVTRCKRQIPSNCHVRLSNCHMPCKGALSSRTAPECAPGSCPRCCAVSDTAGIHTAGHQRTRSAQYRTDSSDDYWDMSNRRLHERSAGKSFQNWRTGILGHCRASQRHLILCLLHLHHP